MDPVHKRIAPQDTKLFVHSSGCIIKHKLDIKGHGNICATTKISANIPINKYIVLHTFLWDKGWRPVKKWSGKRCPEQKSKGYGSTAIG